MTAVGDKVVTALVKVMTKTGVAATLYTRTDPEVPGPLSAHSITSTPIMRQERPTAIAAGTGIVHTAAAPTKARVVVQSALVLGTTPHVGAEFLLTGETKRRRIVEARPIQPDERVVGWTLYLDGG